MIKTNSVSAAAEGYFHSINPMASRIIDDIVAVRNTHTDKWDRLKTEDKDQIICNSFINVDAKEKYLCYPHNKPDYESFPRLSIRSGEKYIVDDESQGKNATGHSWRDEHSGPFSWETQSQLDFALTPSKKKKKTPIPPMKLKTNTFAEQKSESLNFSSVNDAESAIPVTKAPKPPPRKSNFIPAEIGEQVALIASQKNAALKQNQIVVEVNEVKSQPEPRCELQTKVKHVEAENLEDLDENDVPRTGFDFLDNW